MPTLVSRLARAGLMAFALTAAPIGAFAASPAGSYLAAMQADFQSDYVAAARYFDEALVSDPDNAGLLINALVARVAAGQFAEARPLAERLAAADPGNQVATLVLLSDSIAAEKYDEAAAILAATPPDAMNPLLSGLLGGWIEVGRNNIAAATKSFDAMTGNDALVAYGQYNKALALALAGDFVNSAAIFKGDDNGPLHLNRTSIMAHAEVLAQLDQTAEAVAVLDEALSGGVPDAPLIALREKLASGTEVTFDQVTSARDGAAEAFLTLADALQDDEGSQRVALLHARLATHLSPSIVEANLLVADILEGQRQYALATEALATVPPTSPWYVTTEIRRADMQRAAGNPEAGIATLSALATSANDRLEVDFALGDALRMAERYPEAVVAYNRAIEKIGAPREAHWVLFYTRGISNERAGNWPAAEADFRKALELKPGQPSVLNYLGYSLVERQENLDEALQMIQDAVRAQPDDGYITDLLGWVYYRLGRYQDAVQPMLRAVELEPADAVINDHLGDVLWMVGRQREAEFQWRRALSLGPADDLDMDRVRRKIDVGLDGVQKPTPVVQPGQGG